MVKNLPTNAGDTRETDSIPGLGRSPREKIATHSWKTPWTESLAVYTHTHTHTHTHTQYFGVNSAASKCGRSEEKGKLVFFWCSQKKHKEAILVLALLTMEKQRVSIQSIEQSGLFP